MNSAFLEPLIPTDHVRIVTIIFGKSVTMVHAVLWSRIELSNARRIIIKTQPCLELFKLNVLFLYLLRLCRLPIFSNSLDQGQAPRNVNSKTCLKRPFKIGKTEILMTNDSLMKVKSIAECSPWSILQYFWPALSDNRSWKPHFGLLFEWPLKTSFSVQLTARLYS